MTPFLSDTPDQIRVNIPAQLRNLEHWIAWRAEVPEGSTRVTKVPYSLKSGRKASSTNPDDWAPFPDAIPEHHSGLGFVFTKEIHITGVDLDDCLTEDGSTKPWALPILRAFAGTYAEFSPSSTGVKIWAGGNIPGSGAKIFVDSRGDRCAEDNPDRSGAVEMYDTGRYFAVTGWIRSTSELIDCQDAIDDLYAKVRPAESSVSRPHLEVGESIQEGSRHNTLLAAGGRLRNEGFDGDLLRIALGQINATKCHPPKPEREIDGIVAFLLQKPPRYRLVPEDFIRPAAPKVGAQQSVTSQHGAAHQSNAEPNPEPEEPQPQQTDETALARAETVLVAVIESRDAMQIYGAPLITALASAGTLMQHEAKRRLKAAFKSEFSIQEWSARIKEAEDKQRVNEQAFSLYLLTSEGGMRGNLANAITMMDVLPIRFNCFTGRPFLERKSPWGTKGNWTDHDDIKATEWCQRQSLNIEKGTAADAAESISRSRTPHYHPIREYLLSLEWDGHPRLDRWTHKFLGTVDSDYTRAVAAKWMLSAVKRVFEPGCQADYTLVLEGEQGKRKSSALRVLCEGPMMQGWFSDDLTDIGSKDSAMQLQGKWIVEIAELDAVKRADMTTVKAFLVRRDDHFRPPYGRRAEDFPRHNVFAASTNKYDWLSDDTGGRRFWPVKVAQFSEIDARGLASSRDQLWAEAYHRYAAGEIIYLSDDLEAKAAEQQAARQERDPWTDDVEEWIETPSFSGAPGLSRPGRIYLPEVLQHCLQKKIGEWGQGDKNKVSRILRLAGYTTKRENKPVDGKRPEYWVRMK